MALKQKKEQINVGYEWLWERKKERKKEILTWHFHSENTWKVFRPHYAGEMWKVTQKAGTVIRNFGFVFMENSGRETSTHDYRVVIVFKKLHLQKSMLFIHTQSQFRCFPIRPVWRAFQKAPFSWQISVDGRPNRRNKDAFSNSSGELWMGLSWNIILESSIIHKHNWLAGYNTWSTAYLLIEREEGIFIDVIAGNNNSFCKPG